MQTNCGTTLSASAFGTRVRADARFEGSPSDPGNADLWVNMTAEGTHACAWLIHGEDPHAGLNDACDP